MGYNFDIRQETHSTFLHPEGLQLDEDPYVTEWGLILPGVATARFELDAFKEYVASASKEEIKQRPLPTLKQLGRIGISNTGCWELPIYGDGLDEYPSQPGRKRARYGSLMVKGANNKPTDHLAHRTLYRILRGPIPNGDHLDHLCRNARCCYHRHLEIVSVQENTQRIQEAKIMMSGQLRIDETL